MSSGYIEFLKISYKLIIVEVECLVHMSSLLSILLLCVFGILHDRSFQKVNGLGFFFPLCFLGFLQKQRLMLTLLL